MNRAHGEERGGGGGFVDENTRQERINNDQRQIFACIFYAAADEAGAGAKVLALGERRRIEKRCLRWE